MTKENTKRLKLGWFKTKEDDQIELETNGLEQQILITESSQEENLSNINTPDQSSIQSEQGILSKTNQDKVVVDLITSLENIIQDRQLTLHRTNGIEEQLNHANKTIARIKQEQEKKDKVLQEKVKEIRELENSLTTKQMAYDQLLDDYREHQAAANNNYEKISAQLETEIAKYKKLNEESIQIQHQNMLRINTLEEKIRTLEIEIKQYMEQYQNILNEKTELMETINDFTQRMSFSFNPKINTSNSSNSE